MGKSGRKPVIGLLGAIASGKSAVAAAFEKLGCAVIDADKMAKSMLDEPGIKQKIIDVFGTEILDSDGRIDKSKLASIVFVDAAKLNDLNEIIHSPVLEQTKALICSYETKDNVRAIVLDIPLLVEVGWQRRCDVLVFVDLEDSIRYQRAAKRGISKEHLKARENFQISLDNKRALADYIVDNNSDLSELSKQVSRIFNSITSA